MTGGADRTEPPEGAVGGADRAEPPLIGDDRTILTGFLDYQRQTFAWKCAGLDAEQLARRAVPPSELSLLGLLRHLAEVERGWFWQFAGKPGSYLYCTDEDPDLDFHGAVADPAVVEEAYANWWAEIEYARDIVAGAALDDTFSRARRKHLLAALAAGAHDRGVRPAQRARRSAPGTDRRRHRRVIERFGRGYPRRGGPRCPLSTIRLGLRPAPLHTGGPERT
jgi:hypothetical protein